MADDSHRQDYPQQGHAEERYSHPSHRPPYSQPHYPTAGDSSQRPPEDPRGTMAASVSLPSMHDPRTQGYGPPPPQGHGYPTDPRYASPTTTNGYPPPPGQQPGGGYLPPLQPQSDPRAAPGYRPPEQYGAGRQQGGYPQDPQYAQHHEAYYYRGPPQGPHAPPNAYPYPQGPGGPYPEYGPQGGAPAMAQAAPRQRTSIACKYCRKRKIRCSGYQSAPGGKCQNCARMNQECVFQPVSSSSSTAFIPISAVPGGVPPGTPLYGAYGQPLAPQPHPYGGGGPPGQQQQQPSGNYYPHPQAGQPQAQAPPPHHAQPAQSPAESSYSYSSARGDEGSQSGRRRRRSSEDHDEGYRLPPPRVGTTEEEPRRRSPAEFSTKSSPGGLGLPALSRQSPRGNPTLPHPGQPTHDGRSPAGHNGSSGASTPARQGQPGGQGQGGQAGQQSASVMSLSNLVEKNDIDKGMIDRLNRPRDPSAPK